MKKLLTLLIIVPILVITGCTSHEPDAGEEVVFIKKPYIFGSNGVVLDECPGTGLYWTFMSTSSKMVNIKPFQKVEQFDDLITSDNNPVDFQIFISMRVKSYQNDGACYTPILVQNFGNNWYDNKLKQPIREFVRGYTKKKKMFEMTTNDTVTDELSKNLTNYLVNFLNKEKIPVVVLKVTVGRVSPPKAVLEETIATAKQKQRAKTEHERKLAEDSRKNAEISKAIADSAYMTKMNMTPETYVAMKKAENERILYDMLPTLKANIYLGTSPIPMIKQ